jgi:hypothetical protein
MFPRTPQRLLAAFSLLLGTVTFSSTARAEGMIDVAAVERGVGVKPTVNDEEQVCKVTFPRTDVKVIVDGTTLPPFMGLTSWAAFKAGSQGAMVMGDIVLLQDEIAPAMDTAFASGLEVTALHNHFLYDEPRVFFMHIGGEAEPEKLGAAEKQVIEKVKSVRAASPQPTKGTGGRPLPEKRTLTAAALEPIVGYKPAEKDGMVKFTIGREVVMPCNCIAGKELGVNTWAAFYGSESHAIVDGDFVTFPGELQPVLKALRKGGVTITAIHNHMEGENPKAIFLHYWGTGPATDLAKTVRQALDDQRAAASKAHAGHEHHTK